MMMARVMDGAVNGQPVGSSNAIIIPSPYVGCRNSRVKLTIHTLEPPHCGSNFGISTNSHQVLFRLEIQIERTKESRWKQLLRASRVCYNLISLDSWP